MDDKHQHNAAVFSKIAQTYTDEYFDDTSDFADIDRFLKDIKPGGKILDIACGPGMVTKYMVAKGFAAEGIDLSTEMIAIARRKVPEAKFQVMDMRKLDYPAEHFDGLLVTYGLIYVPSSEVASTLKEFNRVLKPGGSIYLINQEGDPDHTEDEAMKPGETLYVNFFDPQTLANDLAAQGFAIFSQNIVPTDNAATMATNLIYTVAKKSA